MIIYSFSDSLVFDLILRINRYKNFDSFDYQLFSTLLFVVKILFIKVGKKDVKKTVIECKF
jgi:hypothetical protein